MKNKAHMTIIIFTFLFIYFQQHMVSASDTNSQAAVSDLARSKNNREISMLEDFEGQYQSTIYGDIPLGWEVSGSENIQFSRTTDSFEGNYALHATGTFDPEYYTTLKKEFHVPPGTTFEVSLRIKVDANTTWSPATEMGIYKIEGSNINGSAYFWYSDSGSYESKSAEFTSETGDFYLLIQLAAGEGTQAASFDLDAISISIPTDIDIQYLNMVQKAYIAYYLRPSDPGGLYWWAIQLENSGGNMNAIIDAYANSEESIRLWGEISSDTIGHLIDVVYIALFDRPADSGGKQFYVDGFNSGRFTPGTIVLNILDGATNQDADAIANKLNYCNKFVAVLDPDGDYQGPFEATYNADDELAARRLLFEITCDSVNITEQQVKQDIIDFIADPGDSILN